VLGSAAFTFGLLAAIATKIPELDPARQHATQANTYVYASDDHTVLAILRGSQARIVVPSEAISPWMKHAIVAVEDKRFYEHHGVDVRGMARALWADISHHGTVQGGSTITQQFVKRTYLTSQKTIARKLVEAALAWQLEQHWSKDKILTAYLNTVYFGNRGYGVEQASRIYFHHRAKTMTPAEAALLAGIPQDPSLYDPILHPAAAKARRDTVLQDLYAQQYLTRQQYQTAIRTPLPNPHTISLQANQGAAAPYFANFVTDQLEHKYGFAHTFGGGLKVKTTLDTGMQKLAQQAVQSVLPNPNGPEAAVVVMDAQTGAVRAMVGGRNYHQSQFNLATQGKRQPGSSFKPFVLATALREGIAPSTQFDSKPITIDADGRLWKVNNFEGEYLGPIDLTRAIAVSDNSVYSQLTALVGPANVAATARSLGITTKLAGYFSIGLGAEYTTPLDMARAYTSFADGGFRTDGSLFGNTARAVESVTDAHGTHPNALVKTPALGSPAQSETRAEVINSMLQGVTQFGTGTAAALPGREVAGKTGTTENYGDAWFVGYTPQLTVAVWVGYPKGLIPMTTEFHGHPVEGGTYPALIWKAFMTKALAYLKAPAESFTPPPSLYASSQQVVSVNQRLELDNGDCKGAVQVQVYSGQGPTTTAGCKLNAVDVPDVVGSTLQAAKHRLRQQPLQASVVYKPAKPGEHLGVVVGQIPKKGTLSAWDTVTLVLAKSLHGSVPKVVGLSVARAQAKLAPLHAKVSIDGSGTRVTTQSPSAGSASSPGLQITLGTGG
jgi:penicillin-binding protein 1A